MEKVFSPLHSNVERKTPSKTFDVLPAKALQSNVGCQFLSLKLQFICLEDYNIENTFYVAFGETDFQSINSFPCIKLFLSENIVNTFYVMH